MSDLVNPDILLIGEGSKTAGDLIEKIYRKIVDNSPSVHRMTRIEAEITKIALNCYLTTKISFANMVGDIAITSGCNPDVILSAIGSDKRIGEKNLKYGFGFGGPCFPRDNRALALFAKDVGLEAQISKASDIANNLHLNFQFNEYKLKYSLSEPIVFSNVAYKPGTTIIEESQKLKLAVMLMEASYSVTIKDYYDIISQVRKLYGDNFNYEVIDSENSKVQKLH
jgi:nucleotide sugar dehydrogenase